MHARRTPARNVFRYPVSYWLVDLDELPELERRLQLVSVNRPNVVSFRDADHFDGDRPLKQAVLDLVGDRGVERVLMLTQPRVLGYVFNPVTFSWCYDAARRARVHRRGAEQHLRRAAARGARRARRCATSTTSGCTSRRSSGSTRATSTRSPSPARRCGRGSTSARAGDRPLTAVLHGRRQELTNASVARALAALPGAARAGHRADPLAGAEAVRQARAVPPQAAVRPRRGLDPTHEEEPAHNRHASDTDT